VAPDKEYHIPLKFKRNSLALSAHIRMVNLSEVEAEPILVEYPLNSIPEEPLIVQTIVKVHDEILDELFRRGWHHTEDGNPFFIMPDTCTFLNPSLVFPWSEWPRRPTLVQLPDFIWEIAEHCVHYCTKMDYEGEIFECYGRPSIVFRANDESLAQQCADHSTAFGLRDCRDTFEARR
jgi:hypothetical protein